MRKLDNQQLDEIGKALVKGDALRTRDVERIVANPALFDSVRMRIELDDASADRPRSVFRRPAITALAGIGAIVFLALAFVTLTDVPADVAQEAAVPLTRQTEIRQFNKGDSVVTAEPDAAGGEEIEIRRISTRPTSVKPRRMRHTVSEEPRPEPEFYALSYAGDPHETERGGRIVRVDISRSTLFAMGVNIPLENDAETVKADLLVGNDGVTRAIRVVR